MNNIAKIQHKLPEFNIDAILITGPKNRLYATGFISSSGALIVTADGAWFITDSRYTQAAEASVTDAVVVPVGKGRKYDDCITDILVENNVAKLGFEDGIISYATFLQWTKRWGGGPGCDTGGSDDSGGAAAPGVSGSSAGIQLVCAQKLINGLRNVKTRAELAKMIETQRLAEKVWHEIIPLITTGITEKELAAEIICRGHKNGADKESFPPIVVSGANSSRPHGVPGNRQIESGFLTIDFGFSLDGWCSDTTRTLCVGRPDSEMQTIYNTVLTAQLAGIAAVRSGAGGADVDKAAREVIEAAGYGDFFGHGFGHSLGLDVHESLSAAPLSEDTLPEGAVISAEPGIYLPGRYGVRIEDVLYVTGAGCENITNLPKELIIL